MNLSNQKINRLISFVKVDKSFRGACFHGTFETCHECDGLYEEYRRIIVEVLELQRPGNAQQQVQADPTNSLT